MPIAPLERASRERSARIRSRVGAGVSSSGSAGASGWAGASGSVRISGSAGASGSAGVSAGGATGGTVRARSALSSDAGAVKSSSEVSG